jgi:hypothetical protein
MSSQRVAEKICIPLEKEVNWEKIGNVICVYSIERMSGTPRIEGGGLETSSHT